MATKPVYKNGLPVVLNGQALEVEVEETGGSVDVVITSIITNVIELRDILSAETGYETYVFAVKSYMSNDPVENQICLGACAGMQGCAIRYKNGAYTALSGWSTGYDAAATIGDIYTVWEASI